MFASAFSFLSSCSIAGVPKIAPELGGQGVMTVQDTLQNERRGTGSRFLTLEALSSLALPGTQ